LRVFGGVAEGRGGGLVGDFLQKLADSTALLVLLGEDGLDGLVEDGLEVLLSLGRALEVLDGLDLLGQLLTL
jgi:hypothetical protein